MILLLSFLACFSQKSKSLFSLVVPQAPNAGMLRLVLVSASNLKCPKGKGTSFFSLFSILE